MKLIFEYTGIEIDKESLKGKDAEEIREKTLLYLKDFYEQKMSMLDKESRKEAEKLIILQILDMQWREHLYEMDTLKTGIGLRGG